MVGIAQDARDMHERLMATTQSQLDGMATQFSTTASTVAHTWTSALTQQEHTQSGLVSALDQSLQTFTQTFEQRSQSLLDTVNQAHLNLQQHTTETLGKTALEMAAQSQAHTTRTLDEMGEEIFQFMLRVASGEKSCSESLGVGENEFVPWQIGVLS